MIFKKYNLVVFVVVLVTLFNASCGGIEAPSVTVTAPPSISVGERIKISWSSYRVSNCEGSATSAEANFKGTVPVSGQYETAPLIIGGSVTFKVKCQLVTDGVVSYVEGVATTNVVKETVVSGVIGKDGGDLSILGVGQVFFDPGALAGQEAKFSKVESKENADLFEETAASFFSANYFQFPYQVKVEVNGGAPKAAVKVILLVPTNLTQMAVNNFRKGELLVFYNLFQVTSYSRLLTVESMEHRFSPDTARFEVEIPPEAFSDDYTNNSGRYTAVLYLAYTDTHPAGAPFSGRFIRDRVKSKPITSAGSNTILYAESQNSQAGCVGAALVSPVDENFPVTSQFSASRMHPITNRPTGHNGTDFGVPTGTPVVAVADGVIERVAYQFNQYNRTGWGWYIVLRHTDRSASLYAHLREGTLISQGARVRAGAIIAESNASGGVTGAHLHVEYSPNGEIYNRASKSDVQACIRPDKVDSSLYIADNGAVSDDAFSVGFDGFKVCETSPGLSQVCMLGGVRPGPHSLSIYCDIAPDNKCTYEISLLNQIKFSNGETDRVGASMRGETINFDVIVN